MPDLPGNQQSNGKPAQGPAIPVFPQSLVIEWEYDIVPVRGRPIAGHTEPPASAVTRPAEVYVEAPIPEATFGASQPPEPDRSAPSEAFYPDHTFSGVNGYAPAFFPPKKRLPIPLITGVTVFVVIITGLLISGLIRHHNGSVPAAAGPSLAATSAAKAPQEMTAAQEVFAAKLFQKLPEALVSMSKQFTQDPVFLEAVSQAKLTDLVFSDNQLDFNIMLPDPQAESLDQLGVANYTPHSGAQAYIRDNYAKLCDMDRMTTCLLVQATLYPKKNADGSLTVDWSLPELTAVPYNYEQVFTPQVLEYMKDKGFFTAAMELMMPDFQSWDKHAGTEHDTAQLEEYFGSLAEALAPKGITLKDKTVVDVDMIKQTLRTRFVKTWAFDSPDIQMAGYRTMLSIRTIGKDWFQDASDELCAQYKAGTRPVPAGLSALEAAYLDNVRQKINADYGSNGLQGSAVYGRQYVFTWQELGEKGIAACPDLVEEIRRYLFSYDFSLMFMARTTGVVSPF